MVTSPKCQPDITSVVLLAYISISDGGFQEFSGRIP